MSEAKSATIGIPGERCSNDHFEDRFTCPNCYVEHDGLGLRAGRRPKFITCECGARLKCEVETIDSSVCTIADPDEEEE
jgi:transcription elongation factor Elf1